MEEHLVRTVIVFLAGVVLSIAVSAGLLRWMLPNALPLISRIFTTPADSPQWEGIGRQLRYASSIVTYVINPLAGLAVGIFVGVFQKTRVVLVAAICLIPDFLDGFLADHAKLWAHSAFGMGLYVVDHSLPFAAAMVSAAICHYLVRAEKHRTVIPFWRRVAGN